MIKIRVDELIKLPVSDIIGKVIVFPTDTVYGIGALCNDLEGIKKIYDLKHRDKSKPLACLASSIEDVLSVVNINNTRTSEFMEHWPGALTLIFEKKDKKLIDESLSTIAFRIPNSNVALKVLKHFGIMAVTSMNISGSLPLNDLKSIEENFGEEIDYLVIDEENLSTVSSTILDVSTSIVKVLRKCAVKFADGFEGKISVTPENLEEFLGARKYKETDLSLDNMIGAVNGLAWTKVGGEIMQIEASILEGTGKIELTGSLGDVMKESAKIAVSFVRSRANELGIDADFYKTKDIHIHAPEGAVPKDGPSAGVTMTTALVSALTNRPVKPDIAMTGEISLRGNVLPIGGLKEKSMAAYKNKMKTVLIPKDNLPDLEKVDDVVKENVQFIAVSTLDEVLNLALTKPKKSPQSKKTTVKIQETSEESQTTVCC